MDIERSVMTRLPCVAKGWIAVPQTSHIISPSDVEAGKALPNGTLPDIRLLMLRDERRMHDAKVSIDLHAESSLAPYISSMRSPWAQ